MQAMWTPQSVNARSGFRALPLATQIRNLEGQEIEEVWLSCAGTKKYKVITPPVPGRAWQGSLASTAPVRASGIALWLRLS